MISRRDAQVAQRPVQREGLPQTVLQDEVGDVPHYRGVLLVPPHMVLVNVLAVHKPRAADEFLVLTQALGAHMAHRVEPEAVDPDFLELRQEALLRRHHVRVACVQLRELAAHPAVLVPLGEVVVRVRLAFEVVVEDPGVAVGEIFPGL